MHKIRKFIISIFILILLLLIVAIVYYKLHATKTIKQATTPLPITTMTTQWQTIPINVTAIGTVVPVQQTEISPKENGYVKAIYFKGGEYVQQGTVLVQLDDAKIKATVQGDKAQLLITKNLYQRYLAANKMKLVKTMDLETARANYEAAKAKLAEDQVSLANTRLTAPFSGHIGAKDFSIGDFVQAGTQLTNLVDRQHLIIEYVLPAANATQVKLNQPVTVQFDHEKQHINGKVVYIAPNIDTNTGTITLHARIDTPNFSITPGEFVQVIQTLGEKRSLTVPEQSLVAALQSYHVFTVKDNKAESAAVQIGENNYGRVEIIQGLHTGEIVIVAGAQHVKDGQTVHSKDHVNETS